MTSYVESDYNTRFHCVTCGKMWGAGDDIGSAGFCIECFAIWAKAKKLCFGEKSPTQVDCKFFKYCQEYYGIRQNLLR